MGVSTRFFEEVSKQFVKQKLQLELSKEFLGGVSTQIIQVIDDHFSIETAMVTTGDSLFVETSI